MLACSSPQEDDWNKAVNETKGFGGKAVSHVGECAGCRTCGAAMQRAMTI